MSDERIDDPALISDLLAEIQQATKDIELAEPAEPYEEIVKPAGNHRGHAQAEQRRRNIITHLRGKKSVGEACELEGITYYTYASYRQRYPQFAAKCDEARALAQMGGTAGWDGSAASLISARRSDRIAGLSTRSSDIAPRMQKNF